MPLQTCGCPETQVPNAAKGEAGRARGVKRRRCAPAIEAAQVHRQVVELLERVRRRLLFCLCGPRAKWSQYLHP